VGEKMRTLLYRVGQEPVFHEAEKEEFATIIDAPELEWMTVRFLKMCVICDARGVESGKPVCQTLGKTPIYGDFIVTCVDWDDDGNTWETDVNDGFAAMIRHMIFNKEYGKSLGPKEKED
jgi:hypothetical protein